MHLARMVEESVQKSWCGPFNLYSFILILKKLKNKISID